MLMNGNHRHGGRARYLARPAQALLGLLIGIALLIAGAPAFAQEKLTLIEAQRLFAQRNRELLLAQHAVAAAEADSVSASARPNPNMYLNATQFGNLYPPGYDYTSRLDRRADIVLGLNQTFERGGKRALRMSAAGSFEEASRRDREDVQRVQLSGLHAAYYSLALAQDKVRITGLAAASFQKTIEALSLRLKAGDIAASDVARMRVDALRAENDARAARAEREHAQNALAYFIGMEAKARSIEAADAWPDAAMPAAAQEMENLLQRRPDIAAARARVLAAEKRRDLARSLRTRDITAAVQFERVPWNPLANPTAVNTFGFGLSVPLFTNYYYDGEIRRAEADLDTARINLERTTALALGDIEDSRADLDSAIDRVRRFKDVLLKEAQKAADGAEFAYSQGAIGVMDLLDSRRQLYFTRLDASTAQADYARSLAAWRAAISAENPR